MVSLDVEDFWSNRNQVLRMCRGGDWQFDRQRKWNTCTNWILTSARYHTQSTGQTKLKLHCIHCHLVMRLSSDAVFAKDTRHDYDDDGCCGWRCEPRQGGPGQAWQERGADVWDGPHQGDNLQFFKINPQMIQSSRKVIKFPSLHLISYQPLYYQERFSSN